VEKVISVEARWWYAAANLSWLFFLAVAGCTGNGALALWNAAEVNEDQCDIAVREIMNEDRATIVDESASRLHAVWISQE
jgi:uncharacterized OsmC-like protein